MNREQLAALAQAAYWDVPDGVETLGDLADAVEKAKQTFSGLDGATAKSAENAA